MPPSLATTAPTTTTSRAGQAGWLLPASLLFVLLMLGRWVQQPASGPATATRPPALPPVALTSAAHLPGPAPAAAL